MSEHGLEPWRAPSAGVYDADNILVASCGTHTIIESLRAQGFGPDARARRIAANARRLAAGPELLDACEQMMIFAPHEEYNEPDEPETLAIHACRTAIAKAKP